MYDKERNLLFTNEDHDNDPYWDLAVTNTLDVTIEGHLDNSKVGSGCAVLLMGSSARTSRTPEPWNAPHA